MNLVICDLVMPILGGREVSDWMKEHCPELPLLFISGYPRAYLEAHLLYNPAVPMLRKPFFPSLQAAQGRGRAADPLRSPSSARAAGAKAAKLAKINTDRRFCGHTLDTRTLDPAL